MKINEVEALAGITKKNIRFYEEQGLIAPRRNLENGYREYEETDVEILRRIKLLRKLSVPIEEIRQMFAGTHTVGDGMRRHLISLERDQRNLQQSIALCQELTAMDIPIAQLDTQALLARMEELEQGGTTFRNVRSQDIRVRYAAPVAVTAIMVGMMLMLSALVLWAFRTDPEHAPPFWFILVILCIFAAVGIGTVTALNQRIREIQKGEIDDAKKY